MKQKLLLTLFSFFMVSSFAFGASAPAIDFPLSLETYNDAHLTGIKEILLNRIQTCPFNIIASSIFLLAIIHTLIASKFEHLAKKIQKQHDAVNQSKHSNVGGHSVSFKAQLFHFLGEVEVIFALWLIPLAVSVFMFYDWPTLTQYIDGKVNFTEPLFVIVIMAIASTKPILHFTQSFLKLFAGIGKCSPAAWWLSILTLSPLLGSFITEPAAMTIGALLLAKQFYKLKPSSKLAYATIGLLFVNISVGGTLTHFAAPPVLMVASKWNWDTAFMFLHFGDRAILGIVLSNLLYYFIFKKEFAALKTNQANAVEAKDLNQSTPFIITLCHIAFMAWTVLNLHHIPLFLGGFLFFLGFTQATANYQDKVSIRSPMLVGLFLAGLVVHGGLQQWWIQPVLQSLTEVPLFLGATILTAFNDNAAITYLATLVPSFAGNLPLQKAVVMGAVTGGGLTVIANAPNPAGQSILSQFFPEGVSPLKLLLGALPPTIIVGLCFMLI